MPTTSMLPVKCPAAGSTGYFLRHVISSRGGGGGNGCRSVAEPILGGWKVTGTNPQPLQFKSSQVEGCAKEPSPGEVPPAWTGSAHLDGPQLWCTVRQLPVFPMDLASRHVDSACAVRNTCVMEKVSEGENGWKLLFLDTCAAAVLQNTEILIHVVHFVIQIYPEDRKWWSMCEYMERCTQVVCDVSLCRISRRKKWWVWVVWGLFWELPVFSF